MGKKQGKKSVKDTGVSHVKKQKLQTVVEVSFFVIYSAKSIRLL